MNKNKKDLLKELKKSILNYKYIKNTRAKKIKEKAGIIPWSEVYGQGNEEYGREK